MCGFLGLIEYNNYTDEIIINEANKLLKHRGPDDFGFYKKKIDNISINLFHHRLSIIDLTSNGKQPFISEDGRYTLLFNGEIYNYLEIKEELEKNNIEFKTNTDTEVLLKSWIYWGRECLNKFNGMFAFTLFDLKEMKIFLIKDIFGMKPLYYFLNEDLFIFSSEIEPILKIIKKTKINSQKAYDYISYSLHDNDRNTFFENIHQLRPAEIITFDIKSKKLSPQNWWSKNFKIKKISENQIIENTKNAFYQNINKHLRSDVKVGVAISGGMDSSSIVFTLKKLNLLNNIELITVITTESKTNELNWISEIETKLGKKIIKLFIDRKEIYENITNVIKIQNEPFGDISVIYEYLIFKKAKELGLKVVIMGHGGDEIFWGYDGYPGIFFKKKFFSSNPLNAFKYLVHYKKSNVYNLSQIFKKILFELSSNSLKTIFLGFSGYKKKPNWLKKNFLNKDIKLGVNYNSLNIKEPLYNKILNSINFNSLPSMLRYADRSSMHFSIECRIPFLSKDILESLLKIPTNQIYNLYYLPKSLLKKITEDIVPEKILNRKDKVGYSKNDEKIYRNLFDDNLLKNSGDFELNKIKKFLEKDFDYVKKNLLLWRIYNFIKWKSYFKEYLLNYDNDNR